LKDLYKRLFKESTIYSLQPVATKAIGIFLIPLYTAFLTTEQYGQFAFIFALGAFLAPFMNLGQTSTFWKYYTESDENNKGKIIFHTALIKLTTGILITSLVVLPAMLIKNTGVILIVHIAGLAIVTSFRTVQGYLRAKHRPGIYLVSAVVFSLLLVGFNIFYVVALRLNSAGVVLGTVSTNIAFGIIGIVFLSRISTITFDRKLVRSMIYFGAPLAFGNIAAFFLGFTDKIMIKFMVGDAALGLYTFSFKFGQMFLAFVIMPFFLGWNPARWEIVRRPDAKQIFSNLAKGFNILMPSLALFTAGVLMLAASVLSQSDEYLIGLKILPLITLAFSFYGMYYFDAMGILFSGKTKKITLILTASALLNLVLNLILIHLMGYFGAALATAGSYVFMRCVTVVISQRLYPIDRSFTLQLVPMLLAVTGCLLAAFSFKVDHLVEIALALAGSGLLLGGILVVFNTLIFKELLALLTRRKQQKM